MATPKKINSKDIYLFDDLSRSEGSRFSTLVTISSKDGQIVGQLSDKFKWNMSADWKPLFQGFQKLSLVQKGFDLVGEHLFKQGVFTRKYYKGNSYIEIPLKFRVTDYEGSGIVMKYSSRLANMMLPRASSVDTKAASNIISSFVTGDQKLENFTTGVQELGSSIANVGGVSLDALKGAADIEAVLDQIEREIGGNSEGSTFAVSVTVGNVFSNSSMIVNSGTVTYSNAQVKNKEGRIVGPLYGDFDVKVTARSVRPKTESGVRYTPSFSNVTITK
jgi:hypothetical protein